jgi:hypothetical protein
MSTYLKDVRREMCCTAAAAGPRVVDVATLDVEELEAMIAPGINMPNHNETSLTPMVELTAEELEAVIAPGMAFNHNEPFLTPPSDLTAEELEAFIAPDIGMNHNETFC